MSGIFFLLSSKLDVQKHVATSIGNLTKYKLPFFLCTCTVFSCYCFFLTHQFGFFLCFIISFRSFSSVYIVIWTLFLFLSWLLFVLTSLCLLFILNIYIYKFSKHDKTNTSWQISIIHYYVADKKVSHVK